MSRAHSTYKKGTSGPFVITPGLPQLWRVPRLETATMAFDEPASAAMVDAASSGDIKLMASLLANPAVDVDYSRTEASACGTFAADQCALHRACRRGSSDAAGLLLRAGALPSKRDRNGRTPSELATAAGHAAIAADIVAFRASTAQLGRKLLDLDVADAYGNLVRGGVRSLELLGSVEPESMGAMGLSGNQARKIVRWQAKNNNIWWSWLGVGVGMLFCLAAAVGGDGGHRSLFAIFFCVVLFAVFITGARFAQMS